MYLAHRPGHSELHTGSWRGSEVPPTAYATPEPILVESELEPEIEPQSDEVNEESVRQESSTPRYSQPEQVGAWTIYRFPRRISIPSVADD